MYNQYGLLELDGPARAFFEWETGIDFGREILVERVTYKTIAVYGDNPVEAAVKMAQVIETVRGVLMSIPSDHHVVWWRVRPEMTEREPFEDLCLSDAEARESRDALKADFEKAYPCQFIIRCRLATTPDLPGELWKQIQKPECGMPPPGMILSKSQETTHASQASHAPHKAHPPHLTVAGGRRSVSIAAIHAQANEASSRDRQD